MAVAVLNEVDGRYLQHSARLGQKVLEWTGQRAVHWHLQEGLTGTVGILSQEAPCGEGQQATNLWCLLPTEGGRHQTLNAFFGIVAEFMDYMYFKSVRKVLFIGARRRKSDPYLPLSQKVVSAAHVFSPRIWRHRPHTRAQTQGVPLPRASLRTST